MTQPIIYLDDNELDLVMMRSCHDLAELDGELITYSKPEELFAHMRDVVAGSTPPPRLLVVDIRMPLMNGFDVVKRLQSDCGVVPPVVFFTTSTRPEDADEAARLGAAFVVKPNDIDAYLALLEADFRP